MTKLVADDVCSACGSLLVPPILSAGVKVPREADYVCLRCGRAYQWIGNPPQLAPVDPRTPLDP